MLLDKQQIENLDRKYKLNLINSISGIKPANLIGTKSNEGKDNVAIFSSVVHLGSSPAQLGIIMRPQGEVPTDTYRNILSTKYYTINHISDSFIKKAHYTSAKLKKGHSEFERMNIEKDFLKDFYAPFVKESNVKIGMKHLQNIPLPNGCIFMIGTVEMIILPDNAINDLGQLDLCMYNCTGISGLNTYYSLNKIDTFPYVRNNEIPDFKE